jgi:putative membrane protein
VSLRTALGALIGAALLAWLLWRAGLAAIGRAILGFGAAGFGAIVVFQLGLAVLTGLAWAVLARGRRDSPPGRYVWGRLVRDAAGQALPFSQVGAVVLGGRALALTGVAGAFATASTVTDLAVEFTGQLAFVAAGAVALSALRPHNPLGTPVLAVIGALALMATALIVAQYSGAPLIERLMRRFLRTRASAEPTSPEGELPVAGAFAAIRRRPGALALAWAMHFLGWLLGAAQTWMTLRLMGQSVSLGGALVVDSLTAGAKAVGFLIPGSLGVQEGALVLLAQIFGIASPAALALSLIRRGRDLAIAVPVLAIWQARHGARIWTLTRPEAAPVGRGRTEG